MGFESHDFARAHRKKFAHVSIHAVNSSALIRCSYEWVWVYRMYLKKDPHERNFIYMSRSNKVNAFDSPYWSWGFFVCRVIIVMGVIMRPIKIPVVCMHGIILLTVMRTSLTIIVWLWFKNKGSLVLCTTFMHIYTLKRWHWNVWGHGTAKFKASLDRMYSDDDNKK